MTQMALPLAWPADPRDDAFLVTPSNQQATRVLEGWASWPVRTAILTGPRRSGRSLLARIFAAKSGGAIVDDAERLGEAELFHAWNRAQEEARPLVIVADAAPPAWTVRLPDLRSRLALSPHAVIEMPDDALVRALLDHLFARRGLDARPDLIDWIAARIERSHLCVERAVDAIDQAAMERRARPTIPLARTVLAASALIAGSPEEP
ncbi:DnaA ATPase domain-containing protein [Sphingomonas rubra]|uniref:DnaA protein n=1 Tax=Sphingomonas rubra TaxID=634430 RepID=A0A1I5PVP6_9SPHN|nr:DnaA/Hda family protein [Sphingomonas rubra]SFP37721.1 dnaA protein [Sphingomonas rubra]